MPQKEFLESQISDVDDIVINIDPISGDQYSTDNYKNTSYYTDSDFDDYYGLGYSSHSSSNENYFNSKYTLEEIQYLPVVVVNQSTTSHSKVVRVYKSSKNNYVTTGNLIDVFSMDLFTLEEILDEHNVPFSFHGDDVVSGDSSDSYDIYEPGDIVSLDESCLATNLCTGEKVYLEVSKPYLFLKISNDSKSCFLLDEYDNEKNIPSLYLFQIDKFKNTLPFTSIGNFLSLDYQTFVQSLALDNYNTYDVLFSYIDDEDFAFFYDGFFSTNIDNDF